MKAHAIALLFCCAAFVVSCSSVDVTTDYDREANFAQYKSFDWMERHNPREGGPSALNNPLTLKNIKSSIERELIAKGIRPDETNPDMLIAVHTGVQDKVDVERHGYRYGRWGRRVGTYTTVERYKEGSIVVDVVDAKSKEMVWRGVAKDVLSKAESRLEYVDESMKALFKEYPPKK